MLRLRIILLLVGLTIISPGLAAQGVILLPKGSETRGKGGSQVLTVPDSKPLGTANDVRGYSVEHRQDFEDVTLKDLERAMQERRWGSEDTAWEIACESGTREAFQKYIAMYPYGAHRADADKHIVDLNVEEAFSGSHGTLPGMNRVEEDDDSPTSTIVVENATNQILTVYYSGEDSRSVKIAPGHKGTVTLKNGHYRIAATVPSPNIRPYAGSENFSGGRYEVGYCIVRSAF